MKRRSSLAIVAAGAMLALSACGGGGDSEAKSDSGVPLVEDGKLTVCSDIPYEPFEFVDGGENVGFDMDLAQATAEDLKVELNVITTAFEAIQSGSALDTAQCDIALSGMSITDDRKTKMDFSEPYLKDNLGLMVTKKSGIKGIDDVKGQKVGVQQATTGETYAKDHGATPVQFEDSGLMTQAIQTGQVDSVIGNISIISTAVESDDKLEFVEEYDTGEVLGAGVKKGNKELLDAFASTMKRLYEDGGYDKSVDKWFGDVADAARIPEADRS
ncbi:ABC transporter substrate-binding protein [Brevibacterium aurantiacum]|jgi:polar amino acid transport system substrate-binding protein|uniref:Amino acid ABC transporter substrate-binding protein n=1 Tax=Brevibacterium aurantiacum TaxID=273384 RepID=A0A1D7W0L5_BREAU|nr:ABC transporter substrate-binding protein [Brevibacterium aurantiacum]AOP52484.1 extracellular solute-binding protein, family 3 [Brevibacterium aurantiacum]AZL04820.1 amino acid ABC transporter substrate-binding protein [Brevibacterium aurantiacum]AZL08403.1 amino acid ABC transporter substrate-binding protein [Brevibacterium aurantiacum]AZL12015.1 amino acid ABC transporter substrate-binding protein [Brevibacterium aurantiacum]PCC53267.1 amino acid ABC transporter substrate-binding protein